MAFWHGKHLDEILKCDSNRTAIMARQLPRILDEHYQCIQLAMHGQYEPRYRPTRTLENAEDLIHRDLDRFSSRANSAIQRYHQRKGVEF